MHNYRYKYNKYINKINILKLLGGNISADSELNFIESIGFEFESPMIQPLLFKPYQKDLIIRKYKHKENDIEKNKVATPIYNEKFFYGRDEDRDANENILKIDEYGNEILVTTDALLYYRNNSYKESVNELYKKIKDTRISLDIFRKFVLYSSDIVIHLYINELASEHLELLYTSKNPVKSCNIIHETISKFINQIKKYFRDECRKHHMILKSYYTDKVEINTTEEYDSLVQYEQDIDNVTVYVQNNYNDVNNRFIYICPSVNKIQQTIDTIVWKPQMTIGVKLHNIINLFRYLSYDINGLNVMINNCYKETLIIINFFNDLYINDYNLKYTDEIEKETIKGFIFLCIYYTNMFTRSIAKFKDSSHDELHSKYFYPFLLRHNMKYIYDYYLKTHPIMTNKLKYIIEVLIYANQYGITTDYECYECDDNINEMYKKYKSSALNHAQTFEKLSKKLRRYETIDDKKREFDLDKSACNLFVYMNNIITNEHILLDDHLHHYTDKKIEIGNAKSFEINDDIILIEIRFFNKELDNTKDIYTLDEMLYIASITGDDFETRCKNTIVKKNPTKYKKEYNEMYNYYEYIPKYK